MYLDLVYSLLTMRATNLHLTSFVGLVDTFLVLEISNSLISSSLYGPCGIILIVIINFLHVVFLFFKSDY